MPTPGIKTDLELLATNLATRHTAVSNQLTAILSALGAPPTTGLITLDNIDARLLTITTMLNSDLATMSDQLERIYSMLANFVVPNTEAIFFALNDLYALQAAGANVRLPAIPSIIDLPTGAELLHCQRVQWMIDAFFNEWMGDIGTQLQALGGVGVALMLAALPVPVLEGAAIPVAMISAGAYALVQVLDLGSISSAATTAKKAALRQALYAEANASLAQIAWNRTVDGFGDVDGTIRQVWKKLIWADWFNNLYDATNHNSTTEPGKWGLTGYDGAVCAPIIPTPGYTVMNSEAITMTVYGASQGIVWSTGSPIPPAGSMFDKNVFLPGDRRGDTITWLSGYTVRITMFDAVGGYRMTMIGPTNPVHIVASDEGIGGFMLTAWDNWPTNVFSIGYEAA
jgi:hypothetical protein